VLRVSNITTWNDKSGNSKNTYKYVFRNQLATPTPTYSATGFNNLPGIVMSAAGQGLAVPMPAGSLSVGLSIFIVLATSSTAGNQCPISRSDVNAVASPVDMYATLRMFGGGGGYTTAYSSDFNTFTTPRIFNFYISPTTGYAEWNNGTDGVTKAYDASKSYSDGVSTITIGTRQYGDISFIGSYGELIVYNSVLSTTDRQKIEGYLAWKWGLQGNLPTGHPYKSAAPV
jgi:hypothetical protein